MRLLTVWESLPECERNQRLKALRATAWLCLGRHDAPRIAVACQCAEAGCDGAMAALAEELRRLPTLSLRRLLCTLANAEVRR